MLAACKQAILHHGGTWPPAGTKTTSGRSASPAIFSDKENSGYLARLSIASSREELLMLCNERGAIASTRARSLQTSQTTTDEPGKRWRSISGLSKGEAIQVYRLRHERLELLHWFEANGRGGKYHYSHWMDGLLKRYLLEVKSFVQNQSLVFMSRARFITQSAQTQILISPN